MRKLPIVVPVLLILLIVGSSNTVGVVQDDVSLPVQLLTAFVLWTVLWLVAVRGRVLTVENFGLAVWSLFLWCLAVAAGTFLLDMKLDYHPAETVTVVIARTSQESKNSYFVDTTTGQRLRVTGGVYKVAKPGKHLTFVQHPGAFGLPWISNFQPEY